MFQQSSKLDRQARQQLRIAKCQQILAQNARPKGCAAPVWAIVVLLVVCGRLGDVTAVQINESFVAIEEDDGEADEEGKTCCHKKRDNNLYTTNISIISIRTFYHETTYANTSNIRIRLDSLVPRCAIGIHLRAVKYLPAHDERRCQTRAPMCAATGI
jgi:hypothetical protein